MKVDLTKQYRTREGDPVKLKKIQHQNLYPVKGLVQHTSTDDKESWVYQFTWMMDGRFSIDGESEFLDLMEVEV
jgi:hypothetical protein